MADIKILRAGPASSVQDLGRFGFLNLGVCHTGAADSRMVKIANSLVGNQLTEACIEFSLLGPKIEIVDGSVLVAVVGDVDVKLNDKLINSFSSFRCAHGDVITVGAVKSHAYAYLAVSGGLKTPELYGSRATHARAGMGGHEGRMLIDGDFLQIGSEMANGLSQSYLPKDQVKSLLKSPSQIEVVLGPQDDAFDKVEIQKFFNNDYTVGRDTDRMGMRLEGEALAHIKGADILSDGIAPGSIQVPGSGLPIVLLAERQTIGGYTKIATVVSSKLGVLSQALPNTELRFVSVTPAESIQLTRLATKDLSRLLKSISPSLIEPDTSTLMGQNLISGVIAEDSNADVDGNVCSCFVSRETCRKHS